MKRLIILGLFLFIAQFSFGQYANLGSGAHKDKIWWFDWSGVSISNGASKVFTTTDGLTVTATFSSITGPVVYPEVMNTWSGAVLHLLYNFSNASIKPAIYTPINTTSSGFTLTFSATRNGIPTPFTLVAADAEASIASEIMTLQTTGSNWKIIDFYRNSSQTTNPTTGCNTNTISILDTYGGAPTTGQNPIVSTNASSSGVIAVNTFFNKPSSPQGAMGVAFGIFAPVDRGDLPIGYGYSHHRLNYSVQNECSHLPPYPSLTPVANLRLGAIPPDADGIQTTDDNTIGADEDALSSIPSYNGSGSYSLNIPVVNTTGGNAYLKAWFDFDRNGLFDATEFSSVSVSNGSSNVIITWTGLPQTLNPGVVSSFALRLRLSTDQSSIQIASGFSPDGEVEDYLIESTTLILSQTSFNAPDTVCVNNAVNITNTSSAASTYYWNYCSPDVINPPSGNLVNNPGNLSFPTFMDYASYNGNYYGFVVNNNPGGLVRLDYGNSLLNTPTSTFLGTFGGAVTFNGQGIQLVNNNGNWIGIHVGGEIASVGPRIVKLDFGNNLTNTPVITNWGNVNGVLDYPTDIYVFKENGIWYGIIVNYRGQTLTRINFGANFTGTPSATNLGNVGALDFPSGFYPVNDNGTWLLFVANTGNNTISRISFGNSLLNPPTGVNLGNVDGVLNIPRDLHIFNDCGSYTGYVVNGGNSSLVKLSFATLSTTPTATVLGNIGSLNTPHSLSKIFRVGSDVYSFAVNLNSNSLTRLKFAGCNNSSVLSSILQNPPVISYNTAGTYKVTLTTDEGLPTQSSFCKQIVVRDIPSIVPMSNQNICSGGHVTLTPTVAGATSYSWNPAAGLSNPNIVNPIASPSSTTQYTLTASNGYCSVQATVTVNILPAISLDFNYTQTSCSPKTIQFNNLTQNTTSIFWDFGNSTTNASSQTPTVSYANYGNYPVKLRVQTTSGCVDSVTKIIPVMVQQDSMISKADTTICKGSSVQLNTLPSLNFCWGGPTGLSNTNITNPIATPTITTTYYFTAQASGTNLIVNGDFSAGNTGFTSDYIHSMPGNTAEAQYGIGTNPNSWWFSFPACGDHTTGSGNMMMVNGSPVVGAKVWQQTIAITPNTNYVFSTWVKSLHATSPANLRFSINSNVQGDNIMASAVTCDWRQFYTTWNSGTNTTATITIINNNTAFNGNDFALDDISFAEVFLKQDSIRINVTDEPDLTVPANSSVCQGQSVLLNAVGATNYSWAPASSLSNPNIANPLAMPLVTTKYYVTGYDVPGCIGRDSVTITVRDTPVITRIADTAFCRGASPITIFASAPGATQYTWSPAAGLSAPNSNNTVANPANTQTYYLEVLGNNGCKSHDSVKVAVLDPPLVDVQSDTSICSGIQALLNTNVSGATSYSWSPSTGLSNPNIANPFASPPALTKYMLTVWNGACSAKDSVIIDVKPLPVLTKSNDTTICNAGQAQLFAAGGIAYQWSPSTGLNNTSISNPIASPTAPTKYYVTVTGANTCNKTDSVSVGWQPKPVFTINPSAVAICIGDSISLAADGADIYSWIEGSNILSPNTSSTLVHPSTTQQFAVAVRHNTCRINDTLRSTVTVHDLPITSASKSNDIDCSNASSTLSATGGVNYSWFPQTTMTGGNTVNPVVSPAVSTTYYVRVTNANTCSAVDSVTVNVLFNPIAGGYHVANAFTPDNNGKNDCFGLKFWGVVQNLDFSVYNRWGEMVFHTTDISYCWDGTYKGIPQASGTYVYQIRAKTACGNVYKKGTVVLMR